MESLVAHLLQGAAMVGEDGDQVAVRGREKERGEGIPRVLLVRSRSHLLLVKPGPFRDKPVAFRLVVLNDLALCMHIQTITELTTGISTYASPSEQYV